MNEQSNTPMSPMPDGPMAFYQVWTKALTKPNEQTFADLAASPNAKAMSAYTWVFVASLIQLFFSFLVNGSVMRQALENSGRGDLPLQGFAFTAVFSICGAPVGALIVTLFFAVGTAIIQWIAKMFGGSGTFDQLAYSFGAIQAPFALASTVFTLLGAIPFVGLCFRIVLSLLSLYVFVLQVMATKGVNRFGWGQAFGSVLIPGAVIGITCCCLFAVAGAAGGFAIQDLIRQVPQGFGP